MHKNFKFATGVHAARDMHSLRGITVVLFIQACIHRGYANPIIPWDKFTEVSTILNQKARHIAQHVLGSSPYVHLKTDDSVLAISSDICSPNNLRTDYKPCLQKIDIALKTHSNMFGADGLFWHPDAALSAAEALSDLQELLHSASLVDKRNPATGKQAAYPKSDWMLEDLRRHSAQRLLSFSILVARVFGAGNPATHGNASGGSCTHS